MVILFTVLNANHYDEFMSHYLYRPLLSALRFIKKQILIIKVYMDKD